MFLGCYQFIYCFKEWLLILTSWVVGFLFMAKCVLTFPTPTRTDEWIGCWVCDRRCWIGCCHWICACLWIEQFAHQSPCCFLNFCIFFRYISLNPFFFSHPPAVFLLPILLPLCLRSVDEGPSTGPHGEGGLVGPSHFQRDWDDQRGESV